MKPWEKYGAPAAAPAGPWAKYGTAPAAEAPEEPISIPGQFATAAENIPEMWGEAIGGNIQAAGEADPASEFARSITRYKNAEGVADKMFALGEAVRSGIAAVPGLLTAEPSAVVAKQRAKAGMADLGEGVADYWDEQQEEIQKPENFTDDPLRFATGYTAEALQGAAGSLAPALGASIIARNPAAGGAVLAPQVFGGDYSDRRRAGAEPQEARTLAGMTAAAEIIPEIGAIDEMMKPAKTVLGRIMRGAGAEAFQEAETALLQDAIDHPEWTIEQRVQSALYAAGLGAIGGGAVGAVMGGKPAGPTPSPVEQEYEANKARLTEAAEAAKQAAAESQQILDEGLQVEDLQAEEIAAAPPPVAPVPTLEEELFALSDQVIQAENAPPANIDLAEESLPVTQIDAAPAPEDVSEPFPPAAPKGGIKAETLPVEELEAAPAPADVAQPEMRPIAPEIIEEGNAALAAPKKQPPIVEFRKQAKEIEARLPPVADGMVRLWRGNRPGEVGQNPSFTNSLDGIALPFKKGYGGPLSYVDIPAADADTYLQTVGVAPGAEFKVPPDVAARAVVVDEAPAPQSPMGDSPKQFTDEAAEAAREVLRKKLNRPKDEELPPPAAKAISANLLDRSTKARERYAAEARLDPAKDDILTAIAKVGGWSREEAKAQGIDPADFNRRGWKLKRVFTTQGDTADGLAERLAQFGYPVTDEQGNYTANALLDRVSHALSGGKIGTAAYTERQAEQAMQAPEPVEDEDPFASYEPAYAPETYDGLETPDEEALFDAARAAIDSGMSEDDVEAFVERAAIQELSNDEIREAIAEARAERERVSSRPETERASREEAAPELLQSYGAEDLEKLKQAEAARAEEARQAEAKAAADDARGSFTLAGSDRATDQLTARGQGGLFDAPTSVDAAAATAATSPDNDLPLPTEAQKEAGNYKKAHVRIAGLDLSIENPAGSRRRPKWPVLKSHYGYIKGTVGHDKDHIDVFIKPGTPDDWSGTVFVVDQRDPKTREFDEHKVMIGFEDQGKAFRGYVDNYTRDWDGFETITAAPIEAFKEWLASGFTKKRYADYAGAVERNANMESAVRIKDVPPAVVKRARVKVKQMWDEGIREAEVSAKEALDDVNREIAAMKKLADCVRGSES
jgi:hypothetical protein